MHCVFLDYIDFSTKIITPGIRCKGNHIQEKEKEELSTN